MSREDAVRFELDYGESGLVPVVCQDAASREVLVLAFANRTAVEATRSSGYATFFSRSRQKLWVKGETSGNRLRVREIRVNCEMNSLLFLVEQEGKGACHAAKPDGAPRRSCYYRRLRADGGLEFLPD